MKELRRRQAEATGRGVPKGSRPTGDDDPDAAADDEDDADGDDLDDELENGTEPSDGESPDLIESAFDDEPPPDEPRPIPLRRPRRRPTFGGVPPGADGGRRPPPPRGRRAGVGGPRDGGFSIRSRLLTIVVVAIVLFIAVMLIVGIQLWTDVLWYKSVGFDQVFWTRLGTQSGLFVGGGLVALAVLLGNLWLAGRLAPSGTGGAAGGSTIRAWIDRLNEAAANADQARSGRGPWERPGRGSGPGSIDVTPVDLPDPVPIGRAVIVIVIVFAALGVAGTVAASWETVVLWLHRVPFDPSGQAVTDPVFHRDISFFLFDLPFLRLIQTIVNGLVIAALIVAGARYLLAAMTGAAVFDTRVRVHLGVLAGLFLMSIALGYQLDKFDLVHSNRGIATGVSYTDFNAQFLAFDVLTGLSAIAAALLVGGAFARVLWPLGLTLAVWFIASIAIGRIYPEVVQRLTVDLLARETGDRRASNTKEPANNSQ